MASGKWFNFFYIGAVTRLNAVKSPQVFRVKSVGYDYNFIRLDVEKTWFSDNRKIFLFQFGTQNEFDEIILDNYAEIEDFERVYDVKFIYHKKIIEKIRPLDNKTETDDFVNDIAQMKDEMFYNELARQAFHGKDIIDPVYILRQYNDSHLIFWGSESFKKGGKVRFPFECFLTLRDVPLSDKFSFLTT